MLFTPETALTKRYVSSSILNVWKAQRSPRATASSRMRMAADLPKYTPTASRYAALLCAWDAAPEPGQNALLRAFNVELHHHAAPGKPASEREKISLCRKWAKSMVLIFRAIGLTLVLDFRKKFTLVEAPRSRKALPLKKNVLMLLDVPTAVSRKIVMRWPASRKADSIVSKRALCVGFASKPNAQSPRSFWRAVPKCWSKTLRTLATG
mmetsp:Transcript_38275/g.89961  ORF Transcript_38275/g.89961 Transcript_38275/m.89961 type:complete len:209 (+) Transcript_38275:102-728(+)